MSPDEESRTQALSYWHAVQTFGSEAADAVLQDPTWGEKYPELLRGIRSEQLRVKYTTLLPSEVVTAIARREECLYDFHADPDGVRLYASFRGQPPTLPFEVKEAVRLPREEALRRYGASCLFRAADLGVGLKGE